MQTKDFYLSKKSFSDGVYDYQVVIISDNPSKPFEELVKELRVTGKLEPRSLMNLGFDPKVWELHGAIRDKYKTFVVKKKK